MDTGHFSGGKTTEVNNAHNVTSTPGLRLQELEPGHRNFIVLSRCCVSGNAVPGQENDSTTP
jgi:hypothetical protein